MTDRQTYRLTGTQTGIKFRGPSIWTMEGKIITLSTNTAPLEHTLHLTLNRPGRTSLHILQYTKYWSRRYFCSGMYKIFTIHYSVRSLDMKNLLNHKKIHVNFFLTGNRLRNFIGWGLKTLTYCSNFYFGNCSVCVYVCVCVCVCK